MPCECTINTNNLVFRSFVRTHKRTKKYVYTWKHESTRFSTSEASRKSTTCVLFWHSTAQHNTIWYDVYVSRHTFGCTMNTNTHAQRTAMHTYARTHAHMYIHTHTACARYTQTRIQLQPQAHIQSHCCDGVLRISYGGMACMCRFVQSASPIHLA